MVQSPDYQDHSSATVDKIEEPKFGGQQKCPKCGSTDIDTSKKLGILICNNCRYEFEEEIYHPINEDIASLSGEKISDGIKNIDTSFSDNITLKCESCGAEVVIDTSDSAHARCHWCRSALTISTQIPNGAIPDAILPFKVKKEEASRLINYFVKKRKFFAHPNFTSEFNLENISGVYFPYMAVDINAHGNFRGQGEKLIRRYSVRVTKNTSETRYDADLYSIERDFDIYINDLTIESNEARLDNRSQVITNNIINSILPFDVEKSVSWNANYLKGYSSEKRNVNIDRVKDIITTQAKDIARHKINESVSFYNRGIRWDDENLDINAKYWHAVYLPVWLYSYQQKLDDGSSLLHYVAVNARTKEFMGSVPIDNKKLFMTSLMVEGLGLILAIILLFTLGRSSDEPFGKFLSATPLMLGFLFYHYQKGRYRNDFARHIHERDTASTIDNMTTNDKLIKRLRGLRNSSMNGINNFRVDSRVNK